MKALKLIEPENHLSDCDSCQYDYKKYIPIKISSKNSAADILVVGDSPNSFEDNKFYDGNSWQLLNSLFKRHKIDLDRVEYTYSLPCHRKGGNAKKPKKANIKACRPRLFDRFKHYEYVILLGPETKRMVLDEANKKITFKQIGWFHYIKQYPGVKFLYTINPASALLGTDSFKTIDSAIKKIAKPHVQVKWEGFKYEVFDSSEATLNFLGLADPRYCAIDIETEVNKDESFTHPKAILSVAITDNAHSAKVIPEVRLQDPLIQKYLKEFCGSNDLLTQNGKFDLQVLARNDLIEEPYVTDDTMLMHYSQDERRGIHSLDYMSMEYLGTPNYSKVIEPYYKGAGKTFRDIPKKLLYEYNAMDAIATYRLPNHLPEPNYPLYTYLRDISDFLTDIELTGIRVDEVLLNKKIVASESKLQGFKQVFLGRYGLENASSPQQVQKALSRLGLKRVGSTDVDSLKAYFKQTTDKNLRKFIKLLLEYRSEEKLYSTYLMAIKTRLVNDFVYPTYKIHGTVSGRLSAAEPNIQNQPRQGDIKQIFIPREGYTFLQADYAQAELRVIATEAKDKYLQGVFKNPDRDIHGEVSDMVYGKSRWNKEQRVRTKAFVFGSAYGREPNSIANAFDMPIHEAQLTQAYFFQMIPEVMEWRQSIQDHILVDKKILSTPFGRKRKFLLITKQNRAKIIKEALSFIPQSIASDLTIKSAIVLNNQFKELTGVTIRNLVHDSILVECPVEDVGHVSAIMKKTMEEVPAEIYSDYVPFKVDVERGPNWGDLV